MTTQSQPSFSLVANPPIEPSQYIFAGTEVPDPITLILALPDSLDREIAIRCWIRTEFNLPKSIRSLCSGCFLRIFSHAQYAIATPTPGLISLGEREYKLQRQSSELVLATAPLIAVSFRTFEGEQHAVAHVWAAKQTNGKGF